MSAAVAPIEVPEFMQPARTFDTASSQVIEYLSQVMPMGMWAVTRVVDGRQITLDVQDSAYGFARGSDIAFADSPCHELVVGAAPQIAPDASGDVVTRLGGDEFGVIVVGAGSDAADRLVGRMSSALEKAGVSGSFGHAPITVVAGFPGAWKAADSAMYIEKRRRRKEQAGRSPN